jgi:hypothetical protein
VLLLLAWTALLAADRIDLFASRGPFTLTPFLVLSPVLIASEWWRRHKAGTPFQLPAAAQPLLLLATLLLACAAGSVLASRDLPRSAARLVQLLLMVAGSTGVLLSIRDRPHPLRLLARGARWGIGLGAVVSVLQLLVLAGVFPAELPASAPIVRLAPSGYAGIIPRLSGVVTDPNRTGLLLVLYGWLVAVGDHRPARRMRWLAVVALLLLLTLSRSALLAVTGMASVTMVHAWYRARRTGQPLAGNGSVPPVAAPLAVPVAVPVALVALLVAVASAAFLLHPGWREGAAALGDTVAQRFSLGEGSARDHLRLLQRGVDVGTRTVGAAVHGIGYGSSHVVLQDFFPGDRYGNFHSLYVGAFAEMGVLGAMALLLLLGRSLRAAPTRGLVVAALLFGVFYSVLAESTFWVIVSLAWVPLAWEPPATAEAPSSVPPKATSTVTAAARMAPSSS